MAGSSLRAAGRLTHDPEVRWVLLVVAVVVLAFVALAAAPVPQAQARLSSSGELAFHPCDQCHPVELDAEGKPTKPLPVDLEKHETELEVHDILGEGDKACLACHDDPASNPGQLILPDGSFVDVTGDVSRVCQRCHFEKYRDWEAGIHGKNQPKCSAAGCHNPHSPSWIYIEALPPFLGTGIEVHAVSEREPFTPLAGPPVPPPVETPLWLSIVSALGAVTSAGIVSILIVGRRRQ